MEDATLTIIGYVLFVLLAVGVILNRRGKHRTIYQP